MNPQDSQIHFCAVLVVIRPEGRRSPRHTRSRMHGRLPTLELLVFVVGTSTLGAEIAAARLMAPFFGDSTIVWANTIAIVLVALSVGYWFGGRLADRHPHLHGLCLLVLVAALLLGLVPIVAHPFLALSVKAFDTISVGVFAGSLFGTLALVAIPVLMLGAVSPWRSGSSCARWRTRARWPGACTPSRPPARCSGRSWPRCCSSRWSARSGPSCSSRSPSRSSRCSAWAGGGSPRRSWSPRCSPCRPGRSSPPR